MPRLITNLAQKKKLLQGFQKYFINGPLLFNLFINNLMYFVQCKLQGNMHTTITCPKTKASKNQGLRQVLKIND